MADNPLTQKYGGLVGWQWVAVAGVGIGGLLYLRQRAAAKAAAQPAGDTLAQTDLANGPLPGAGAVIPVIIQAYPPPVAAPKPPVKPPPKPAPKPKPKPKPKPAPKPKPKAKPTTKAKASPRAIGGTLPAPGRAAPSPGSPVKPGPVVR